MKKITLIDPSEFVLKKAAEYVASTLSSMGVGSVRLVKLPKSLPLVSGTDGLSEIHIDCFCAFHFFSNVIDIPSVSITRTRELLLNSWRRKDFTRNFVMATHPSSRFIDPNGARMNAFCSLDDIECYEDVDIAFDKHYSHQIRDEGVLSSGREWVHLFSFQLIEIYSNGYCDQMSEFADEHVRIQWIKWYLKDYPECDPLNELGKENISEVNSGSVGNKTSLPVQRVIPKYEGGTDFGKLEKRERRKWIVRLVVRIVLALFLVYCFIGWIFFESFMLEYVFIFGVSILFFYYGLKCS